MDSVSNENPFLKSTDRQLKKMETTTTVRTLSKPLVTNDQEYKSHDSLLFISQISPQVQEQAMKNLFSPYAEILGLRFVSRDNNKKFGFLNVRDQKQAEKIISMFDGYLLNGQNIHITYSREKKIVPLSNVLQSDKEGHGDSKFYQNADKSSLQSSKFYKDCAKQGSDSSKFYRNFTQKESVSPQSSRFFKKDSQQNFASYQSSKNEGKMFQNTISSFNSYKKEDQTENVPKDFNLENIEQVESPLVDYKFENDFSNSVKDTHLSDSKDAKESINEPKKDSKSFFNFENLEDVENFKVNYQKNFCVGPSKNPKNENTKKSSTEVVLEEKKAFYNFENVEDGQSSDDSIYCADRFERTSPCIKNVDNDRLGNNDPERSIGDVSNYYKLVDIEHQNEPPTKDYTVVYKNPEFSKPLEFENASDIEKSKFVGLNNFYHFENLEEDDIFESEPCVSDDDDRKIYFEDLTEFGGVTGCIDDLLLETNISDNQCDDSIDCDKYYLFHDFE